MKQFKILFALLIVSFIGYNAAGQANASLNLLTLNSGQVYIGNVVDVQVSVGNSGPAIIGVNKVRAQISIPGAIATTLPDAQQTGLPAGWIILSNAGGVITVCNGTDQIAAGDQRQILIKIQGVNTGGPSTIAGSLSFGPGSGVCTGPGSLSGDNVGDNTSTSSIEVLPAPPCTLSLTRSAGTIACNGQTTTLTVTPSGANGAVEYSLTGGAPFQAGNTFTVGAGIYTVTAREVANIACTATATSITITQPATLIASANAPSIGLPGGTTTVTVSATGGTAPYTGTGTFSNVSAGTHSYTVTDSRGCTSVATITLMDPTPGPANASINLLTLNSGQVYVGNIVDLQVSIGNTGPSFIGANKVRAQISIPASIATAVTNAQQIGLPSGWTILSNTGGVITICNGTDQIPSGTQRQILIKIQGVTAGGPSTIAGSLSFGPGTGVCTGPGSLSGDNVGDNTSTSTIEVLPAPPCTLSLTRSAGTIECNGQTTTLTVTPSGANGAVEYSLTGGAPFQAGNTFTVGAGTYTVTAREVANIACSATATSITITQPATLIASANAPSIGLPGGTTTVTVTATGGTSPYTGTGTFSNVPAGTHSYTVTDSRGCTSVATITLMDPAPGPANASINLLTLNSGQVNVGDIIDLQVSVGNTGPGFIGVNKVRAQISIPASIATAVANAQQIGLPAGWIILSNTGGVITICNGTDQIPSGVQRQIFIKIQGVAAGGPSTIAGSLSFGPGTGVCTGPGSLSGDIVGDNTSTSSITVSGANTVTANLRMYIQGYYIFAGEMQPVLLNQGLAAQITETDTVSITLHHPTTYVALETVKAVLSTTGFVTATFTQPAGNYYIGIRHRNAIQTWTAEPVACSSTTPLYDFTIGAAMALGDNQVMVETGKFAFYTGDINQDNFIDGNDFPPYDEDNFNAVNTVYVATDLNGDGFVDGNDFPVYDLNNFNAVSAIFFE